jgi:hypothetical protein
MTAEDTTTEPAVPLSTVPVSSGDPGSGTSHPGLRAAEARHEPGEARLPAGARPARNAVIGVGLISYAWILAGTAPFTMKALLGVLLPGAVLGGIAFGRPPERVPAPESVDLAGLSYWIICIALLFEWEASAVRDSSGPAHPSLTDLINPLLGPHPVKCAAIVIWLLGGWALVKR